MGEEVKIVRDDKRALLFGVEFAVGRYCLDFLLSHNSYKEVRVFSRKKLSIEHDKLEVISFDYRKIGPIEDLIKGDDLYIALGTSLLPGFKADNLLELMFRHTVAIAKKGALNEVNQLLLVSSVSADSNALFGIHKMRGQIEEIVKKLPFWSIHIFKPSFVLDERSTSTAGEGMANKLRKGLDFFTKGLFTKYRPVEADVVARAMVQASQGVKKGIFVYDSNWLQHMASREDNLRKLT